MDGTDGGEYTRLPTMVQFAVADVEAHNHLARVVQASRMWRAVAEELGTLADSLRRELDGLRANWRDATGTEFVRQAMQRRSAVEELLARIAEHQPWLALDDLARQLLLTRARLTGTAEQATTGAEEEGAAHLSELDRYFLAAADAVLGAAGHEGRPAGIVPATAGSGGDACCVDPGSAVPSMALEPGTGSALPPGSLAMPGLVAVPPGLSAYGGIPRNGGGSPRASTGHAGGTFDPSTLAGGDLGSGGSGSHATSAGSLPGTGGSDFPPRIEQAAKPVSLSGPPAAPEAPQPPAAPVTGGAGSSAGTGMGRMFPPMMMPMMPGGGRSAARRGGSTRSLEDSERTSKRPAGAPGVPARLRGRSGLADPAASGVRPIAMSGTRHSTPPAEQQALDREVWQVENSGAASPLKPEPVEEPPRPRRRRS